MTAYYQQVLNGAYDNHVLPFLWMKGESHQTIAAYLEQIASADIREVCLESRPHPDFCGESWWRDLRFVIDTCKQLGLKIWILDDAHFPTGYANGAVKEAAPELRKIVLTHRTIDVVGPTPQASIALTNMFDKTERFYGVTFMQDGRVIEVEHRVIKDEHGTPCRLVFHAPAGITQACVMFTSGKTSYNEDYINMVDRASVAQLIDAVYEPHFAHLGDEFGKTVLGFFSDEPGFANEKGATGACGISDTLIGKATAPLPWSAELERRLRAALGERYLDELPHLWDREDAGAHARHTYMDIASTLYRECFCDQLGDWCRAHGVQYIGHVIEDKDCHARLGAGAGHYFRAVSGQDMAGVDIVINQLVPGMDRGLHSYGRDVWDLEFYNYVLPKLGSSAAHLDPKKQGRCMAEVFGAFGWHEGLREMKWIADHFMVRGVNWFVPHAFSMAAFPDFDCPPHFYAHGQNPQFAHFGKLMSYMNRTSSLLSGGRAATPVALLYHADAEWAGEASFVQHAAAELVRAQIDFDIVPAEAFEDAERYTVEVAADGSGLSVNGQAYRCLVVPSAEYAGGAVLDFTARATTAGVGVYALDRLPSKRYDGEVASRAGFAPVEASELAGVRLVATSELASVLSAAGMQTVVCTEPQPWLRALRYDRAGESYLMLVNEHPKQGIHTHVALADGTPVRGARLDLLDGRAPVAFDGALELAPYESCIVVLGATVAAAGTRRGTDAEQSVVQVKGPWSVSFAAPGADAADSAFGEAIELSDLHDLSSAEFAGKAGTFRYQARFSVDEDLDRAALDLSEVFETAIVVLDGADLGCRICPPYRFGLGHLAAGEHALTIDVINTLDHAIPDMFALTEPSEPSGLLGPVLVFG